MPSQKIQAPPRNHLVTLPGCSSDFQTLRSKIRKNHVHGKFPIRELARIARTLRNVVISSIFRINFKEANLQERLWV